MRGKRPPVIWSEPVSSLQLSRVSGITGPPDLNTTDTKAEASFRPWNPAHGKQLLPREEQRPNPSKSTVLGKCLSELTLLFDFYSSTSG